MRVVFHIYASLPGDRPPRLMYAALEDCHPDNIEYRAKVLLLTLTIDEHPDLVRVLRFDDGRLLYERSAATKPASLDPATLAAHPLRTGLGS